MGQSQDRRLQILGSFRPDTDRSKNFSPEAPKQTRDTGNYAPARTILFVDDDPTILQVRRLIFEVMGYRVLTADSGEEALETFRANPVDAVVVDYLMSGMDGEETARRIRGMRPNLPIILSSGCLAVPQRVLDTVSASVHKAMRPEVLFDVLEQQLQLAPAAKGAH